MTSGYTFAFSPRLAPEFLPDLPPEIEGAGNAGRSLRPQPCVRNEKAHTRRHHGHTGSPGIPRAMVLTAYSALSPVSRACLPPSLARCESILANLTPASGCQDHT